LSTQRRSWPARGPSRSTRFLLPKRGSDVRSLRSVSQVWPGVRHGGARRVSITA